MKDAKHFTCRQLFGLHFRSRHQVDDHKNQRHVPISLESKVANKLWPDCNFAWYLNVSKVNTDLASGHLQNDGIVQPSLDFWISLAIDFLGNTIGVELVDNCQPNRTYKIPLYVPCEKITVKLHGGMWGSIIIKRKKWNKNIKSGTFRTIQNTLKLPGSIVSVPGVYYYSLD